MRRRHKAKVNWMPVLGSILQDESGDTVHIAARYLGLQASPNASDAGTPQTEALVPDYTSQPNDDGSVGQTLRDFTEGQDWFLHRIVGKLHITVKNVSNATDRSVVWSRLLVSAGFFVARANDDSEGTPDLVADEQDPQAIKAIRNPWIWRRTWVLGTPGVQSNVSGTYPTSNVDYGSVADGPHIDAKSKRRILRNQRLWFAWSIRGCDQDFITVSGIADDQPQAEAVLDYRIVGAMRKARNVSAF